MDSTINMLPLQQNLRNFKVLESNQQVMIVATDKHREKYHIIRIDKKDDKDCALFKLDAIIKEEVMTFTETEYQQYMACVKD